MENNKKYTELLWNGKYSEAWFKEFFDLKKKANIQIDKPNLAFQTVETINQPRVKGGVQKSIFPESEFPENYPKDWKNLLVWGDNKLVMSSLLKDYAGKINLIYIDPPFFTGADFTIRTTIGDEEVIKEPSIIEEKAYGDTWAGGIASYLKYMYERLVLMKDLLADDGSIYVHCDWHVSHYLKCMLDEIFEYDNFRNEITVRRTAKHTAMQFDEVRTLQVANDSIFVYAKSDKTSFNKPLKEASEKQKLGSWHGFSDMCYRPTQRYKLFNMYPPSQDGRWLWAKERAERSVKNYEEFESLKKQDRIGSFEEYAKNNPDKEFVRFNNGSPQYWIIARDKIMCDTQWDDIQAYSQLFGYDTEKSELLLQRIIEMASKPSDVIADFFCGSGTTGAVAEKLGRRWLMADLSKFAIHTTRKRLMNIHESKNLLNEGKDYDKPARPFEILNIGNYELEYLNSSPSDYLAFMLKLYGAEPVTGFRFVHGKKGIRLVHIGSLNAPVSLAEVKSVVKECADNNITKLDILGWEWSYEVNDFAKELAKKQGVDLRLIQIPSVNEIKSALVGFDLKLLKVPEQVVDEKILKSLKFSEVSYLEIEPKVDSKKVVLKITDFQIPPSEWLDEIKDSIKKYSDLIDYWAVDWDYQGDTFHNQWQTYRTKAEPKIEVEAKKTYERAGEYEIMVKVIDVFGNDTNKIVKVKIR